MKAELEVDASLIATAGVTILIAILIGIGIRQSASTKKDIRDYKVKTPHTLDVLGTSIEEFKQDMSEAKLTVSSEKYTGRFKGVEKAFEWEFKPKGERSEEFMKFMSDVGLDFTDMGSRRIVKKATFTAWIDRTGRIVSTRLIKLFSDVDTFRHYYRFRLVTMMDMVGSNSDKLRCFNVEPKMFEPNSVEKFYLNEEEISDWKYVRRCEQAGVNITNAKGQGEITKFALYLDRDKKPEERTKKNKGDRSIIEAAVFEGYLKKNPSL